MLLEAWIFLLTIVCTPGASTHGDTYEVQTYITSNKKGQVPRHAKQWFTPTSQFMTD